MNRLNNAIMLLEIKSLRKTSSMFRYSMFSSTNSSDDKVITRSSTTTIKSQNTRKVGTDNDHNDDDNNKKISFDGLKRKNPKRVWRTELSFAKNKNSNINPNSKSNNIPVSPFQNVWHRSVDDTDLSSMRDVVNRISVQVRLIYVKKTVYLSRFFALLSY